MAQRKKGVKREKNNIAYGAAHIQATFNNTIVTITDPNGGVITWASAGNLGFKGSRKGTPYAAQMAAAAAAKKAMDFGMKQVDIFAKGPGAGRESAIRALQATGLEINLIKDVTPVPHKWLREGAKHQVCQRRHGRKRRCSLCHRIVMREFPC